MLSLPANSSSVVNSSSAVNSSGVVNGSGPAQPFTYSHIHVFTGGGGSMSGVSGVDGGADA